MKRIRKLASIVCRCSMTRAENGFSTWQTLIAMRTMERSNRCANLPILARLTANERSIVTLNLAALQRQLTEKQDLAAIPQISPEDRAAKLAEYQATVDQFAGEERQALEKVDPQHVPDYWTLRTLKTAMQKHRAAQKSLERLQRAIAKA